MKEPGRTYLHLASVGDERACASVLSIMRPLLKATHARGETAGYRVLIIRNADDAEEELLPFMFDYQSATNSRFPFVYVGVQPSDAMTIALDDVLLEQGFKRFP